MNVIDEMNTVDEMNTIDEVDEIDKLNAIARKFVAKNTVADASYDATEASEATSSSATITATASVIIDTIDSVTDTANDNTINNAMDNGIDTVMKTSDDNTAIETDTVLDNVVNNATSATDTVLDNVANNTAAETNTVVDPLTNTFDSIDSIINTAKQPFAIVRGQALESLPEDLYIPPDALEVILEIFEGPLDLLLYLIRRHNIDILNIPVAEITRQYVEYVELMKVFRLDLAAEYLEMAALLAEIKSRMLLPRPPSEIGPEIDPRAELVRRLQEYERFKKAAQNLEEIPRLERDIFLGTAELPKFEIKRPEPTVDLKEVLLAFKDVLKRIDLKEMHTIQKEPLSIRERMSRILSTISTAIESDKFINFATFFDLTEGRIGVVVTFIAILELMKEGLIELVQNESYGPIYVRGASHVEEA